ncbi:MAG: FHA domain-containing protein [Polyangiaceae bacterium]
MAILRRRDGGAVVALAAHCLVGRSPACTLRVDGSLVSREHARLQFSDGAWTVRDLGSSNGTFVDGERLPAGGTRALPAGCQLGFGSAEAGWELVDASPPTAMARRLEDEATITPEGGVLALPSPERPLVSLLESAGKWILEVEGQARDARDGEVVTLAGVAYMLHLPAGSASTAEADQNVFKKGMAETEIELRVSRDEEQVEVTVRGPAGVHVLAPRAHHYTLLTIARIRVRDRDGALVEAQRGWVTIDDLMRALRLDEMHLNVEIYRIRKAFTALGLQGGAGVIERRRGARQLRLGTERVKIVEA